MITSTANAQIRTLTQLKKKAKEHRQQQLYVAEGVRMFREAPAEEIERIYVSASFLSDPENAVLLEGRRYEVLSDAVFGHVSDTQTPQGILCLMRMHRYRLSDVLGEPGGVWLILENIQDPGNLGTMLRVGEGAGIAGVIMDRFTADIYNPKTIRSTMGSIYRVPFYITEDLPETIREIKSRDIRVYAAYLKGSRCYDEEDYIGSTAFLIGNEGSGLTEETAALADRRIRIPMHGKVESLNAAMAAGILMYEADRQRRGG
ncbi:MAG: RNA methyltransferase [Lachnospiraceae bacterium]|nr:RNA methyltransferase [Lachnospiraceae bacterium]